MKISTLVSIYILTLSATKFSFAELVPEQWCSKCPPGADLTLLERDRYDCRVTGTNQTAGAPFWAKPSWAKVIWDVQGGRCIDTYIRFGDEFCYRCPVDYELNIAVTDYRKQSGNIYQGFLTRSVNYHAPSPDHEKCPISKIRCSGKGPRITATINQDGSQIQISISGTDLTTLSIYRNVGMSCGNSIKVKDGALTMKLIKQSGEDVYTYTPDKKNALQNLTCQGKNCDVTARAWLAGSTLHFEYQGASSENYSYCGFTKRQWNWTAQMQHSQ